MGRKPGFTFGVVEGFYGVFYTFPERVALIRFIGRHGYNRYVYAPKNDRQHRVHWWEQYPERIMREFAETTRAAREAGVAFCYAISPGGSICFHSAADFDRLTSKLHAFYDIGVRGFALLMDDNAPGFRHLEDAKAYPSLPYAQADLANRLYAWLQELDPACTLDFIPSDYSGRPPFSPALIELALQLHTDINICYTGTEVCSPEITTEDIRAFTEATGRRPIIWDNYPVNDLSMQPELHLGPVTGRAAGLPEVAQGILVNPMIQPEASRIPLLTYAAYITAPDRYDPSTAWEAALREVAGEAYAAPLHLLADNTITSCLGTNVERLDRLAPAALESLRQGCLDSPAVRNLEAYLDEIDEAGYTLKFRLENLALRADLLPWIEVLEHWMWMTRFSLRVLRAVEQGQPYDYEMSRVEEYREAIASHSKRIATQALKPLFNLVQAKVEQALYIKTGTRFNSQ